MQRSLVAPPVGTFRQGLGSLVVRLTGKGTLPITNLPVRIVQGATNVTDDTNTFGCAVFRYVPVGSYTVTFNRPGFVDTNGVNMVSTSGTVSEGTLNVVSLSYDRGASVLATFDTEHRGTPCTPPACPVSRGMGITLESSDIPSTGYRGFPVGATNQTAQQTAITTPLLYPFNSAYGVYSGNCTDANPLNLTPRSTPPLPRTPAGSTLGSCCTR